MPASPAPPDVRAVLWDLDGTLVDSAGDIAAAVDGVLQARGLPALGEAAVRRAIGDGARHLVTTCVRAAGGEPADDDLPRFLAIYRAAVCVRTQLCAEGLRGLLARIAVPMAVVTNKPGEHTEAILKALDLDALFPVVIAGDTLPVRKPDPGPVLEALRRLGAASGVLVGDGLQDAGAARAAGVPFVGVGWGIHRPPGEVVHTVEALEARLAGHLPPGAIRPPTLVDRATPGALR